MCGKSFRAIGKKGAACVGLFLGVSLSISGCVKPTVGPSATNTPVVTVTGEARPTPEPTAVPITGTPTPQVTAPTVKPTVAPTAEPTAVPELTPPVMATPTECPENTPVITPENTPTPELQEGEITEAPTSTPEVLPEPTATPVPVPTAVPEYDTLLQNGWQRTEDFFGCREIFFSGKFDDAEPVIVDGGYEFSYRAASDASVLLRIIGEEKREIDTFLEKLRQSYSECLIAGEGPEDYSYAYIDGKTQVYGRIYACGTEEKEQRMRVEFYSPAGSNAQTEGYGFYLR